MIHESKMEKRRERRDEEMDEGWRGRWNDEETYRGMDGA